MQLAAGAMARLEMSGEQHIDPATGEHRPSARGAPDYLLLGVSGVDIEGMMGDDHFDEIGVEPAHRFAQVSNLNGVDPTAFYSQGPCRVDPQYGDFIVDIRGSRL